MFKDRFDAGKKLANKLSKYHGEKDAIILVLPRGGVIVGAEVAKELKLPLDIIVTRKISHPMNPEYAIGAVGENSVELDQGASEVEKDYLEEEIEKQRKEIARRIKVYRGTKKPVIIKDKIIILVDDGIATGLTMIAAIKEIKGKNPRKIVVAVPVGAPDTVNRIKPLVDEIICLESPENFIAVGQFYEEFGQTPDEKVINILHNKNIDKIK